MEKESLRSAVALSHFFLRERVERGDRVVDATCGNGKDTLLLAELVKKQVLMKRGAGNNFWYELVGPQPQPGSPAGTGAK